MAESSKDELLQLIKRFGAYLTVKMSSLFPISLFNLNSRSIGAIAGFAVAIVFTWRLLRSPSGPQRRQPKRQAPASSSSGISSNSNATLTTMGVSPSQDSRAQNVVDEFFQPVKPTLGQIVRQKLSEGRKVTCRLLGVVLEESTPEELQKQATVRYSVLEVLLEITKFCDLYLMERVLDDESEKKVLLALEDAGIFTSGGLVKDKVLFCCTENGRTSFVRQLEPDWHIDTNPDVIFQLSVGWDCIALPFDVESSDEAAFRMQIRELAFTDRDGQATIIALKPISKGDDEVTISYVDEDLPYEERQALLADYGFKCRCPICLEEP